MSDEHTYKHALEVTDEDLKELHAELGEVESVDAVCDVCGALGTLQLVRLRSRWFVRCEEHRIDLSDPPYEMIQVEDIGPDLIEEK